MSVKHVIESGTEIGSVMYNLVEAKKRNVDTKILLDPNARGVQNGMDTVDHSLTFLFSNYENMDEGDDHHNHYNFCSLCCGWSSCSISPLGSSSA
jgi:hypothetical protein